MSDHLFDTTVFIDWWRGVPEAVSLVDSVVSGDNTASYSAITSLELYQFDSLGRQEEIEYAALCLLMEEVPVSSQIAGTAGQMLRNLSRNQRRRPGADALIAASAMSRGEKIYSRNQRDISRFYSEVDSY
jgi:predicted nucleic acid-binding protein